MDAPHAAWHSSSNMTTEQLINEFIKYYTEQPNLYNNLYTNVQIEQIIRMYITDKLDNSKDILFSAGGLNVVRSNYHRELKSIFKNKEELLNLLIDVYVNELFINFNNIKKNIIKKYINNDNETISIIKNYIENNFNEIDIHANLLNALSDVKCRHISYIESNFVI